ncbi:MAG: thioredoxin domain-containing protein [Vicinamibacterales bacterium]
MRVTPRGLAVVVCLVAPTLVVHGQVASERPREEAARVLGRPVTVADLDARWDALDPVGRSDVATQVHEGRMRALESLVDEILLDAAAREAGLPVDALLARELPALVEAPDAAAARAIFDQMVPRSPTVSFIEVESLLTAYLGEQARAAARDRYLQRLRAAAAGRMAVWLEPPRWALPADVDSPRSGPPDARIEVVVFADFECPYCRQLAPVLRALTQRRPDEVRLVWRDFPLPGHAQARTLAQAARCAGEQGAFWPFHDHLFAAAGGLLTATAPTTAPTGPSSTGGGDTLLRAAAEIGLDVALFTACSTHGRHREAIERDVALGMALGVTATPTLFVNGRKVVGLRTIDAYEALIMEELRLQDSHLGAKP